MHVLSDDRLNTSRIVKATLLLPGTGTHVTEGNQWNCGVTWTRVHSGLESNLWIRMGRIEEKQSAGAIIGVRVESIGIATDERNRVSVKREKKK